MSDDAELESLEPATPPSAEAVGDASDDDTGPIEVESLLDPAPVAETEPLLEPEPEPASLIPANEAEPNTLPFILEAIASLELSVQSRFDGLLSIFQREVRAEATREKVVDRLHAELQEYKNDLLLNTLRPVFIDLIQLHDDIGKIVGSSENGEPPSASRLLDLMRGFQQGIEDILYRQGVEPYQNLADDGFDPRRQRAYATVPNDDPALAKRIAARLRKGFQTGEKVIRPEIVSVYSTPK